METIMIVKCSNLVLPQPVFLVLTENEFFKSVELFCCIFHGTKKQSSHIDMHKSTLPVLLYTFYNKHSKLKEML